MLIINADDFGLNQNANRAIVQAFAERLCSSCTIMANMPAFEEACGLAHEHELQNHVGVHLNLAEGYPLTEEIRKLPRFCNREGLFRLSRKERFFTLNTDEKEAVAEETLAQIAKCRKFKIPLTHLDSHRHPHEEWGIASVIIPIVLKEGIPYIRLSRNFGPGISIAKRIYKQFLNQRLRRAGLARTEYFGSSEDYDSYLKSVRDPQALPLSWEVMAHPVLDEQERLIDSWIEKPLGSAIEALHGYEKAVSFGGHRYQSKLAGTPCSLNQTP